MATQFESMTLPPRLPLVVTTANRGGFSTKDSRLVNCYIETSDQEELWVYKRPGYEQAFSIGGAAAGLGSYYWRGDFYSVFGNQLYKNGVIVSGATPLDTTNGVYRFEQHLGATPKLILGNGKKTYTFDGTTLSAHLNSIEPNFPSETVKGIVYLNGAVYVMNKQGEIWGSAINSVDQPGNWTALNFIAAQIEADDGICLAKQLVYVIAFNEWSTEVFFDAGNPEGSPLGNVQGSKLSYGCENADSVQRIDDRLFWVSTNQTAATQISMMDQLNHRVISTKPIDRLLQASDLSVIYSWQLKISGHSFYVLTIKNANITLAYDINEDLWHQWTDTNGNYIPIVSSTYDAQNRHILQHETNGILYYCDFDIYTDANAKIYVDIYTPMFDANTRRRKHMTRMTFVGDQEPGSTLYVRHSNDDYQSWSNFRSVDLSRKDPHLINLGTFTKRAYHFRHWANTPLRLQAAEVQYDLGTL